MFVNVAAARGLGRGRVVPRKLCQLSRPHSPFADREPRPRCVVHYSVLIGFVQWSSLREARKN